MCRYISPQFWLTYPLLSDEFLPVSIFYCHTNPMITDEDSGIIKQVACGLPTGLQALAYYTRPLVSLPGLNLVAAPPSPLHLALAVTIVAGGLLTLLAWCVFLLCGGRRRPQQPLNSSRL